MKEKRSKIRRLIRRDGGVEKVVKKNHLSKRVTGKGDGYRGGAFGEGYKRSEGNGVEKLLRLAPRFACEQRQTKLGRWSLETPKREHEPMKLEKTQTGNSKSKKKSLGKDIRPARNREKGGD